MDGQSRALVAKENELYLVDHGGQYQKQVTGFYPVPMLFVETSNRLLLITISCKMQYQEM